MLDREIYKSYTLNLIYPHHYAGISSQHGRRPPPPVRYRPIPFYTVWDGVILLP